MAAGGSRTELQRQPSEHNMTLAIQSAIVLVLTLPLSLATTRVVDGEVPAAVDFFAGNEQAPQAIRAGQASPTTNDHARAERARADAMRSSTPPPHTHRVAGSADPRNGG